MQAFIVCIILTTCYLSFGCGLQKYISVGHHVTPTNAMAPTIRAGDHFTSAGIRDNDVDPIQRFDIVVFKPPVNEKLRISEDTRFVFRVIGLSGEKIEIKKGVVYINDAPLDETAFEKVSETESFKAVLIPVNEYFLLGDNRPDSMDSKYIGTIKRNDIDAKVNNIIRKEDYDNGKRW